MLSTHYYMSIKEPPKKRTPSNWQLILGATSSQNVLLFRWKTKMNISPWATPPLLALTAVAAADWVAYLQPHQPSVESTSNNLASNRDTVPSAFIRSLFFATTKMTRFVGGCPVVLQHSSLRWICAKNVAPVALTLTTCWGKLLQQHHSTRQLVSASSLAGSKLTGTLNYSTL